MKFRLFIQSPRRMRMMRLTTRLPKHAALRALLRPPFEAGYSRLIGSIHFPSDNIQGLATGERIAREVMANAFQPVPEPSSIVLLGTAIISTVGLLVIRSS